MSQQYLIRTCTQTEAEEEISMTNTVEGFKKTYFRYLMNVPKKEVNSFVEKSLKEVLPDIFPTSDINRPRLRPRLHNNNHVNVRDADDRRVMERFIAFRELMHRQDAYNPNPLNVRPRHNRDHPES